MRGPALPGGRAARASRASLFAPRGPAGQAVPGAGESVGARPEAAAARFCSARARGPPSGWALDPPAPGQRRLPAAWARPRCGLARPFGCSENPVSAGRITFCRVGEGGFIRTSPPPPPARGFQFESKGVELLESVRSPWWQKGCCINGVRGAEPLPAGPLYLLLRLRAASEPGTWSGPAGSPAWCLGAHRTRRGPHRPPSREGFSTSFPG